MKGRVMKGQVMKNGKTLMVRALAALIAIILTVSLYSCGGDANMSNVDYKADELLTKMMEGLDLGYEFAPVQMLKVAGEEGEYFTGIKNSASLVEEQAAYITPMMGQAFQITVVRVKDVKDVDTVMQEMKEGNDLNRWICMSAEQLIVTANGKHIVCVMGTKEETKKVTDAFDAQFTSKSSERLTK